MKAFIGRYVSFDHCRAVLPWFEFAGGRTPFARARKFALEKENELAGHGQPNGLIAALLYLPSSLRQMQIALSTYGRRVRRDFGVGYTRQLTDLVCLAWRHNHAPHDYYLQKMWLRPRRAEWGAFLSQREHVLLVKQLQRALPLAEFDDKLQLHVRLQAAGVPTIDVLLAAMDGRWLEGFPALRDPALLRQDLVIKPSNETMYEGVEIWRYDPRENIYTGPPYTKAGGVEKSMSGEKLDLSGLRERVLQGAKQRPYLVQRRMRNHPALEAISPHAIANFRLATVCRDGKTEAIAAILRMGYDTRRFISGNYQANVDLAIGELGMATGCLPQWGYGKTHLETGAPVAGVKIVQWPELRAIAERAHAQFPWMPAIGWDIVSTDEGPMVMEANAFWGVNISQVDCAFLGERGYAEAWWEAYNRIARDGIGSQVGERVTADQSSDLY